MPPKKQKQKEFLGRAIYKQRFGGNIKDDPKTSGLHTTDIDQNAENAKKMQSVTQFTDFQELFDYANLAEKDFSAEKQNAIVITAEQQKQQRVLLTKEYPIEIMMKHWNDVTVPRRPAWDENTTAQELQETEKQYFLEWRRRLAKMEEEKGLLLSPFEKNIEVWRQLWRVVERSEIIVQIVDARNPLLFRCPDLEKYVKEVDEDKINILLVNKADLLSKQQRNEWAKYFKANNVEFLFFSANYEKLKMEQKTLEKQRLLKQQVGEEMDLEEQEDISLELDDSEEEKETEQDELSESSRVLNREDLLEYLMQYYDEESHTDEEGNATRMTIGMVGYPNVGKSSTINVLVGEKKVSVSSTPGKTKHFQTININESIQLCDCPGLVFPTFMSTKAEMICNGLLSIDHMREHNSPMTLLSRRIPREIIEKSYGIVLPKPMSHEDPNRDPTAEEILQAHGTVRGYMTARGTPNESVSAREILKDYVTGLLVFAHPPPGITAKEFNKTTKILNKKLSTKKTLQQEKPQEKDPKIPVGKQEEEEEGEEEEQKENKMETLTIGKKSKKKKKANRKHLEPTVKNANINVMEDPDFRKQEKVVASTTGKHAKVNFIRPKVYHTVVPVAQLRAAKKQLDKTQALARSVSKDSKSEINE